jgi:hypothetical protein
MHCGVQPQDSMTLLYHKLQQFCASPAVLLKLLYDVCLGSLLAAGFACVAADCRTT